MIDIQVAFDKLAGFETVEEIAEFLSGEGIKGYKGQPGNCAIAKWIQQTTGIEIVRVNYFRVATGGSIINITDQMKQFMYRFDIGKYPELTLGEGL